VVGITATVKDGVATLTGEAADVTVKTKAEASAKAVDGVKSVVKQRDPETAADSNAGRGRPGIDR
jgi:osmotically-inducible protein OsmY